MSVVPRSHRILSLALGCLSTLLTASGASALPAPPTALETVRMAAAALEAARFDMIGLYFPRDPSTLQRVLALSPTDRASVAERLRAATVISATETRVALATDSSSGAQPGVVVEADGQGGWVIRSW